MKKRIGPMAGLESCDDALGSTFKLPFKYVGVRISGWWWNVYWLSFHVGIRERHHVVGLGVGVVVASLKQVLANAPRPQHTSRLVL